MGITIYSVQKGKAPVEVRPKSGETLQTRVSCQGDIAVQPFYPETSDGVAWLLLCQGPAGEPGRDINGEVDEGPRMLQDQPGVLIGAEDPRSLDVIIEALTELRRELAKARDIEELLQAGDQLVRDARSYGEHLVEHAKSGMSGVRPGVDMPEVDALGRHIHEASKAIQDEVGRDLHQTFEEAQRAEKDEEPPTIRMERGGFPAAPERSRKP